MTAAPEIDVLDAVPAPRDRECKIWRPDDSGEMEPCGRNAEVLFVYDSKIDGDENKPLNMIACRRCAPVRDNRNLSYTGDRNGSQAGDGDGE